MVRGNFYGAPSTQVLPEPFEILSSSEEDNISIAFHRCGGHATVVEGSSRGEERSSSSHNDDRDDGEGVTPDDSFLEELGEIQYLPPLNISPLKTVLLEKGSAYGSVPSSSG